VTFEENHQRTFGFVMSPAGLLPVDNVALFIVKGTHKQWNFFHESLAKWNTVSLTSIQIKAAMDSHDQVSNQH
jgi:hypothetical protein